MQAASHLSIAVPAHRRYRNRPDPPSLNRSDADSIGESVYLVDDDPLVREELCRCLAALNLNVVACASAASCLECVQRDAAACVIMNICLPDLCGLELQRRLRKIDNFPVIFICDQCDIASTVCAMKAGAIDFFTKPINLPALIEAVQVAYAKGLRLRKRQAELRKLQERHSALTPREREVLPLVVGGLLNKQAASILGISEVTLQIHRSQVMRKMQAESLPELVRMAVELRISHWRPTTQQTGSWQSEPR
jgi:FixJ family two-component response regulator